MKLRILNRSSGVITIQLLYNHGKFPSVLDSVMLVFEDHQTVRKVVRALPAVGVGPHCGLLQTRLDHENIYTNGSVRSHMVKVFYSSHLLTFSSGHEYVEKSKGLFVVNGPRKYIVY